MKFLTGLFVPLLLAAAAEPPTHAVPQVLTMEQINCAAEDMQLFYHFLNPQIHKARKEPESRCGGVETIVKMPEWLEKNLPAMTDRKVWEDPKEGKLSEAAVWQAPVSVLYELADTTRKTLSGAGNEKPVSPFMLEKTYNDIRTRLLLCMDRLVRAKLGDSFEGRGKGLISTLNVITERIDSLTSAIASQDKNGFYESARETAELSRDLFTQLFQEPRQEPAYKYTPEPRILPGYRGISLPVSGYQTLFLNKGERIDLLTTFEAMMVKGTRETVTATILQNVIVLNVSRPETAGGKGVVQLLCNPVEAQYAVLGLAQSKSVNIIRRAQGDTEMHPMEIASFVKLFR